MEIASFIIGGVCVGSVVLMFAKVRLGALQTQASFDIALAKEDAEWHKCCHERVADSHAVLLERNTRAINFIKELPRCHGKEKVILGMLSGDA